MKKNILTFFSILALLVFFASGSSLAAKAPEVEQQPQDWKEAASLKAHSDLGSREWTVYVWQAETKGALNPETDVLTFSGGTVTSRNLSAQGYPASNYGLFIGDDGSVSWETMQAKELPNEVDLAFVRGSLANGTLNGSIVLQPQKGAKRKFIYSTQMPDEKAQQAAQQAAQPAPTTSRKSRR